MRQSPALFCSLIVCVGAALGCQDSRLRSEVARLEDQLKQTDKRLEVAATQIETANQQIADLKNSLRESQADIEKEKQRASAQALGFKHEKAELQKLLDRSREELIATQTKLAKHEKEKADLHKRLEDLAEELSILGVWELKVADKQFRFAFFDDGTVVTRELNDFNTKKFVWTEPIKGITHQLSGKYSYRRKSGAEFEFSETGQAATGGAEDRGRVVVNSLDTANIWIDVSGGIFANEYGKPKWFSMKRIADVEHQPK